MGQAQHHNGAFAQRGLHHHVAAMQARQRLDQREAKAGALFGASLGAFHLFERLAQLLQIRLGDTGAGVAHRQDDAVFQGGRHRHLAAARREFDAIADQIDQHLLDGALVGKNLPRRGHNLQTHRHAAALRRMADKANGGRGHFVQVEQFFIEFKLAGLDLGHVEHAIDQLQQMAAGFVDQPGIFLVARRSHRAKNLPRHHFGKTDNRVQRRAQFMAHIGQEIGLGA